MGFTRLLLLDTSLLCVAGGTCEAFCVCDAGPVVSAGRGRFDTVAIGGNAAREASTIGVAFAQRAGACAYGAIGLKARSLGRATGLVTAVDGVVAGGAFALVAVLALCALAVLGALVGGTGLTTALCGVADRVLHRGGLGDTRAVKTGRVEVHAVVTALLAGRFAALLGGLAGGGGTHVLTPILEEAFLARDTTGLVAAVNRDEPWLSDTASSLAVFALCAVTHTAALLGRYVDFGSLWWCAVLAEVSCGAFLLLPLCRGCLSCRWWSTLAPSHQRKNQTKRDQQSTYLPTMNPSHGKLPFHLATTNHQEPDPILTRSATNITFHLCFLPGRVWMEGLFYRPWRKNLAWA